MDGTGNGMEWNGKGNQREWNRKEGQENGTERKERVWDRMEWKER